MRFVPTGPRGPVEILTVKIRRHLIGLIVEKAFAHTELLLAIFVLQASPEYAVNKLLKLIQLIFIGLAQLLYDRRYPRASPSLVSKTCNPRTAVLHDDLIRLVVVAHEGRSAMKRIRCIREPLLRRQKMAHVGQGLSLGLGHEIVNRLDQTVFVSNCQARAAPQLSL